MVQLFESWKASFPSGSLLLFGVEHVFLEIKEELATQISVADGLCVVHGKGFATGKHEILGDFNTKGACS